MEWKNRPDMFKILLQIKKKAIFNFLKVVLQLPVSTSPVQHFNHTDV